jgi:hypothetical protein
MGSLSLKSFLAIISSLFDPFCFSEISIETVVSALNSRELCVLEKRLDFFFLPCGRWWEEYEKLRAACRTRPGFLWEA